MGACNFEYLVQFVDEKLDPERQLELYEHLSRCAICRDAVCQISRDLKRTLTIYCYRCAEHGPRRPRAKMDRSGGAPARGRLAARPAKEKPAEGERFAAGRG